MEIPKRQGVEPVLGHHVEEPLPELEVAAGFQVDIRRGSGPVWRPGKVELDRPEREARIRDLFLDPVQAAGHAYLLRDIEEPVHGPALVPAQNEDAGPLCGGFGNPLFGWTHRARVRTLPPRLRRRPQ